MSFSDGKTVLVLGAGASQEVGLPVGSELKKQIGALVNITYDWTDLRSGSSDVVDALNVITEGDHEELVQYCEAGRKLNRAMPLAISIDNYLDAHSSDKYVKTIGKLGITKAILYAERQSELYVDVRDRDAQIRFDRIEDKWFSTFFQILTENCPISELKDRLKNVEIVSFNYDRCLMHFLYHSIQNYYSVDGGVAADVLSCLKVHYPYGSVGELPWQHGEDSVHFGTEGRGYVLLKLIDRIQTFTEGSSEPSGPVQEIRDAITDCQHLIFLGFAYHALNMELLMPAKRDYSPKFLFGTAFKISEANCSEIMNLLTSLTQSTHKRVFLRNDLKCDGLLHEYWRKITHF